MAQSFSTRAHALWLRIERSVLFYVIRFFRIRGESERVARGFALGLIVNFFPTFGLGVLFSGVFARVFGGNVAAGLIGGSLLTFFWPVLFYANMRTGSWIEQRRNPIRDPTEITERTMSALAWGQTFSTGAIVNSLVAGAAAYLVLRLLYERTRPSALAYLRAHAREHQRKFSLHHDGR